jgi:uncharacterized protein YceH (UPF0502 family)
VTQHRRRFELFLPRRVSAGEEAPPELILQTVRDLEYELGGVLVETQLVRGLNRETGEIEERFVRLFTDVRDTAENLAYFHKLKKELGKRFGAEEIRVTTFLVDVL